MDVRLLLDDPFDAPQPTNVGEALDYHKAKSANKEDGGVECLRALVKAAHVATARDLGKLFQDLVNNVIGIRYGFLAIIVIVLTITKAEKCRLVSRQGLDQPNDYGAHGSIHSILDEHRRAGLDLMTKFVPQRPVPIIVSKDA